LSSSAAHVSDSNTTVEVHQCVLQRTYAYFFDTGLSHLLTAVERVMMDVWEEAAAGAAEAAGDEDALMST